MKKENKEWISKELKIIFNQKLIYTDMFDECKAFFKNEVENSGEDKEELKKYFKEEIKNILEKDIEELVF